MSGVLEQRDLLDGQIVELQLGPPPANLVTDEFVRLLSAKLTELVESTHLKLLVLRGQGDNFSYGASIQEHRPEEIRAVLPRFHALIGDLLEFPVPTLAAVSGNCLGGGLELALACSMVIADAGARFGFPEIRLGVFPPVGALLLSRSAPASLSAGTGPGPWAPSFFQGRLSRTGRRRPPRPVTASRLSRSTTARTS